MISRKEKKIESVGILNQGVPALSLCTGPTEPSELRTSLVEYTVFIILKICQNQQSDTFHREYLAFR